MAAHQGVGSASGQDPEDRRSAPVTCRIVPFVPGRRPTDEVEHPGLGSSDTAMVVLGDTDRPNQAMVLFDIDAVPPGARVEATVTLEGRLGDRAPVVLAGWAGRPIELGQSRRGRHRIVLTPDVDLRSHDLGLGVGLLRSARVEVRVARGDEVLAADQTRLDVCDIRQLGCLYQRVLDRVVAPDTSRQASAAGVDDPGLAFHPWYPVLWIGGDKAALYTRAIVEDVVDKGHQLTDPAWLLRVGIHLELLTCLGIAQAVRDDVGDLLDPAERAAVDASPEMAAILDRLDVDAWRRVWSLRRIAFARLGTPRTGPVSVTNLLIKRRATMAFLHAHHHDLQHAIELAGPNRHNSQETWQRVFRDAERAVLRQSTAAFPELGYLPEPMRDLVLWQRRGFADQQGLYATACVQYRASMNHVADWAKALGFMDFTGNECIPTSASLLHAHMFEPARVAVLQHHDGYGPSLEPTPLESAGEPTSLEDVAEMLARCAVLEILSETELIDLAAASRPIVLGPAERLVQHGDEGTSLFVVVGGEVEVVVRLIDGSDLFIERMGPDAVIGEMALLTGERRSATVRAGPDGALVYEIGAARYGEILATHPEWIDQLAELMESRLTRHAGNPAEGPGGTVRGRIRRRFFGDAGSGADEAARPTPR